jgi:hypothetical protein
VTTTSIAGATTTTPVTTSTSTTLPDPCASVPVGPTFASIECRLDDLGVSVGALGALTPRGPALRDRLGQATGLERTAHARCGGGDAKRAKKSLKAAFKKLGRLRAQLGAKGLKKLPGRDALLADVNAVRLDVRSLKSALSCPAAAGAAAGAPRSSRAPLSASAA